MKNQKIMFSLSLALLLLGCGFVHAASGGVEDLLVDFSDYLSTRLIPAAGMTGVAIGGVMAGLGSPKGIDVVKFSIIGGIIGTAGAQTLSALFF